MTMRVSTRLPPIGALALHLAPIAVTIVLILQNTKQALLPARQTAILWIAEAAVLLSVIVLRSGWARDTDWTRAQGELGTLANNYYEPRRAWLTSGFAVGLGVLGGLWWAAATWIVMFTGMRRGVPGRALLDFEIAALMGTISGGIIGAVIGLAVGHVWERRHRRRRLARKVAHA
jgi:hypothetical protein